MKINFNVRAKNPVFWFHIFTSFLFPVLTYFGLTAQDVTSWPILFGILRDAFLNPYVLVTALAGVWAAITDPTTKGYSDGSLGLTYKNPAE